MEECAIIETQTAFQLFGNASQSVLEYLVGIECQDVSSLLFFALEDKSSAGSCSHSPLILLNGLTTIHLIQSMENLDLIVLSMTLFIRSSLAASDRFVCLCRLGTALRTIFLLLKFPRNVTRGAKNNVNANYVLFVCEIRPLKMTLKQLLA